MGTTYFVANAAKLQYFEPSHVGAGENTKQSGVLWGLSGHAFAQLLLPDVKLDFGLSTWVGDPLVLVGDEAEPNPIALLQEYQRAPDQDAYHIVTEQFDDISLNLIALLCKRNEILKHFVETAAEHYYAFVDLAHIVMYMSAPHVAAAFEGRFGGAWRDRYFDALAAEPWHYPLPLSDRTRELPRPRVLVPADIPEVLARRRAES